MISHLFAQGDSAEDKDQGVLGCEPVGEQQQMHDGEEDEDDISLKSENDEEEVCIPVYS